MGLGVVVGVPSRQPAFAFHICRYLVGEPPPSRRVVHIPKLLAEPHVSGALAAEALFLPDRFLVDSWMVAPPGLEPGLVSFWTDLPDVPFTVPLGVHQRRQFDRSWRIATVCTPGETGLAFSPEEQASVGWGVLARSNKAAAVSALAWLACRAEVNRRDPLVIDLVKQMRLPAPYGGRLLAAARGGQPVFDPKALRWMIAELVAAEQSEMESRAGWTPTGHSGADLLASAWFPCHLADRQLQMFSGRSGCCTRTFTGQKGPSLTPTVSSQALPHSVMPPPRKATGFPSSSVGPASGT